MNRPQTHYVYRLFIGYEVAYVGCTSRPETRIREHRATKEWWPQVTSWEFIGPLPKDDALLLETTITEVESPLYSLSGRDVGRLAYAARQRSLAART